MSQALERVNSIYLIGTIEFYSKLKPDHWQEAHDELEMAAALLKDSPNYFQDLGPHIQTFVATLEDLTEKFKPFSQGKKEPSPVTGFYSNSQEEAGQRRSISQKSCAECGTKSNLSAVKSPKNGKPMIICKKCYQQMELPI